MLCTRDLILFCVAASSLIFVLGCSTPPQGCTDNADCADGLFCTATDTCSGGVCVGSGDRCPGLLCDEANDQCVECFTGEDCDDENLCTDDSCDPETLECEYVNNTLACDDDDACTKNDACWLGTCAGTAVDCDDGDVCTTDECVDGQCVFTEVVCRDGFCDTATGECVEETLCQTDNDCDDGLFCNGPETCVGGGCQLGSDPCDDGVGCTIDSCDEGTAACTSTPDNGLCDDGSLCTDAFCDPLMDCRYIPDDTNSCDDGLFCNGVEVCASGDCLSSNDPCPGQLCRESDDTCVECLSNSDCDDAAYCNGAETCDADGNCQPGSDPCAGQPCHEGDDTCTDCLSDGDCDDSLFCTGEEICDEYGVCQSAGDPCEPDEWCDEENDLCESTMARMFILPAGVDPNATEPGTYTTVAVGGDDIVLDVWLENTHPAKVYYWQVWFDCTATGGTIGSIDFLSDAVDESREEYIFFGLPTLPPVENQGQCDDPEYDPYTNGPRTQSVCSDSDQAPVITDPVYLSTWTFRVSANAAGIFTIGPYCTWEDECSPLDRTWLLDDNSDLLAHVRHTLEVEVTTTQCCDRDAYMSDDDNRDGSGCPPPQAPLLQSLIP